MKVRMKVRIEGTRNGVRWPEAGGVVDVTDGEGRDLVSEGLAEVVPVPEKRVAEKATARKAEKRG